MSSALQERLPRADQRTPEDWRGLTIQRLDRAALNAAVYEDYYNGRHPLQFATSKYREAFGNLFGAFADNWCQIVVDACVERLKIVGFQIDGTPSTDAWDIWQENSLDVESVIAHTETGKCGRAFLLVDPNDGEPRITVEHCAQMIVINDPGDRRKRLAAMKRWLGEDGYQYLTLYLPDAVLKWESSRPVEVGAAVIGQVEWVERQGEPPMVPNTLGVVPAIPLENKPGLLGVAHSDLEPAVPLQNAVNKLCSDLIIASEYGAFPQRVATGVSVPLDPTTGEPLRSEELKAAMSRLWAFPAADARLSALPAADLSNFVTAIEMFIQHLAAQTRTPPHYLLGKMVNASGDALSVAEAGLVSKCRAKTLFFSDAWEEALALALTATGQDAAHANCETIWANPERITQAQLTDAAVKKKTLGIPLPVIWLELGYTPEQIAEMVKIEEAAREAELVLAAQAEAAKAREVLTTPADSTVAAVPGEPVPTAAPTATPSSQQPPFRGGQ